MSFHTEPAQAPARAPERGTPGETQGPMQSSLAQMEQRLQAHFDTMHRESLETHRLLKDDLQEVKADIVKRQKAQETQNAKTEQRFNSIEAELSKSLSSCVQSLQTALADQREAKREDMRSHGDQMRSQLTEEMRSQLNTIRKRTPSPVVRDDEKKMKN